MSLQDEQPLLTNIILYVNSSTGNRSNMVLKKIYKNTPKKGMQYLLNRPSLVVSLGLIVVDIATRGLLSRLFQCE